MVSDEGKLSVLEKEMERFEPIYTIECYDKPGEQARMINVAKIKTCWLLKGATRNLKYAIKDINGRVLCMEQTMPKKMGVENSATNFQTFGASVMPNPRPNISFSWTLSI